MAVKPVKDGYITSGYGYRTNPFDPTKKEFHPGIDIGSKSVRPIVVSPLSGIVYIHGYSQTFGYRVWIKLESGMYMVIAHLESINITIHNGKYIKEGDEIGIMGNTGKSQGRHTHIEIRPNPSIPGNSIEPIEIINTFKE